jgi:capsular polysaccharide biosynthesis protein
LIRRGQQGAARVLTNAAEIEQILVAQGFHIVDPEQSTVQEIVAATQGARLVVGLEGSHLLHCIYTMAQNGGLCVLQPPFRFNNVLKNYADCVGISYGFVIGEANEHGFAINPDELLHILAAIDSALPA